VLCFPRYILRLIGDVWQYWLVGSWYPPWLMRLPSGGTDSPLGPLDAGLWPLVGALELGRLFCLVTVVTLDGGMDIAIS